MSAAASRHRLNQAIAALHRFASSRKLDPLHADRSGVDLNLAAVGVLGRLADHEPVSLGELSRLTGMQPSALSRQVKLLEEAGHLDRRPDPDDGRVSLVRATSKGRAAYRRVMQANDQLLSAQLRDWSTTDLEHAADVIERLVADLRRH